MERSSYLELMDRSKLQTAYESPEEAFSEELLALRVLLQLYGQKRAGAISLDFARRDWLLVRLHLDSRREASRENGMETGFCSVSECLSLNRPEQLAVLLAAASQTGELDSDTLGRLRGDRKKTAASLEASETLYGFLNELEAQTEASGPGGSLGGGVCPSRPAGLVKRERIRLEKAALFLRSGGTEGEETAMVPRPRVLNILIHGRGPGSLPRFCRRRTSTAGLPELLIYDDLLQKLIRMCSPAAADTASAGVGSTAVLRRGESWTPGLIGAKGSGKELVARHLAAALKRDLLILDGKALARMKKDPSSVLKATETAADWEQELLCECLLTGDLLYFTEPEPEDLTLLRAALPGVLLVGMEEKKLLDDPVVFLELPIPTAEEKARLWSALLKEYPHADDLEPEALGSKYVLNAGGIRQVLQAAGKWARGKGKKEIGNEEISWAVHQSESGQLGSFANLVPAVFCWDDLIVEEKVKTQLSYICGQLKYRSLVGNQWGFFEKMPYGRGLCALFYGPPGTGKTMAVQVIAKELGLDLYRVDLSRMVSKYIGETEKNISALFDKAKHMNVILFFDEADSFFSKRSEVKDANDRNANAEVSHLLQRLEEYEGITILATNLKENIDDAFKRRIKFMVNFRFPSAETRKRLWKSLLPEQAPREEGLDMDFFAEHFELSGSQIKEILLNAAYIAAGEGRPIGNDQIKRALCLNYEKYGKILTKEDFGYLG